MRCRETGREAGERRPGAESTALTLIEMLAVVAIFALMATLIAPRVAPSPPRPAPQAERVAASSSSRVSDRSSPRAPPRAPRPRRAATSGVAGHRGGGQRPRARARCRLDLRGETPLPLAAARAAERVLPPAARPDRPLRVPRDELAFAGLQTPEGWIERGEVSIEFERDGTASYTEIYLDDESGRTLVLDVLPLADAVRISDATS